MESESPICECLQFVFDYELAHGNSVRKLETRPNLGRTVIFWQRLKIWGTPATGQIPKGTQYWDSGGPAEGEWYESGFRCDQHQWLVIGGCVPYPK